MTRRAPFHVWVQQATDEQLEKRALNELNSYLWNSWGKRDLQINDDCVSRALSCLRVLWERGRQQQL